MTRPFSVAFKQKMVQRLTGKDAVSAMQLSRETGVRQQNLSRWLQDARSLPRVSPNPANLRRWSVEQKARVVAEAAKLTGEQLQAYLDQAGVQLVEFERWRIALQDEGRSCSATSKRIRQLERELARKEKALASTFVATLQWLGVIPSFSRPHVSDDNPYSEALFRTLKHTPAYPRLPFESLACAQRWMTRFAAWYNREHRHSAIRYVTPDERHYGREKEILARRQRLYERARRTNPERWTGATRNWTPVHAVSLNPTGASGLTNT